MRRSSRLQSNAQQVNHTSMTSTTTTTTPNSRKRSHVNNADILISGNKPQPPPVLSYAAYNGNNNVHMLHDPSKNRSPMSYVKNLIFEETPFYPMKKMLVHPTIMVMRNRDRDLHNWSTQFTIAEPFLSLLNLRDYQGAHRYQIQLRMYTDKPGIVQEINYPDFCDMYLNGRPVQVPEMIQVTVGRKKVSKRPSVPLDISLLCRKDAGPQNISCKWTHTSGIKFVITIMIVERVTTDYLLKKAMEKNKYMIETVDMIKNSFGDDGDISVDHLKVSLLCPYGRQVMKIPGRSTTCDHIQCFDLTNYIVMNEKRQKWRCPVCGKDATFSSLVVDAYFERIIRETHGQAHEVELLSNGGWKKVGPDVETTINLDSSDDDEPNNKLVPIETPIRPSLMPIEQAFRPRAPYNMNEPSNPLHMPTLERQPSSYPDLSFPHLSDVNDIDMRMDTSCNYTPYSYPPVKATPPEVITLSDSEDNSSESSSSSESSTAAGEGNNDFPVYDDPSTKRPISMTFFNSNQLRSHASKSFMRNEHASTSWRNYLNEECNRVQKMSQPLILGKATEPIIINVKPSTSRTNVINEGGHDVICLSDSDDDDIVAVKTANEANVVRKYSSESFQYKTIIKPSLSETGTSSQSSQNGDSEDNSGKNKAPSSKNSQDGEITNDEAANKNKEIEMTRSKSNSLSGDNPGATLTTEKAKAIEKDVHDELDKLLQITENC